MNHVEEAKNKKWKWSMTDKFLIRIEWKWSSPCADKDIVNQLCSYLWFLLDLLLLNFWKKNCLHKRHMNPLRTLGFSSQKVIPPTLTLSTISMTQLGFPSYRSEFTGFSVCLLLLAPQKTWWATAGESENRKQQFCPQFNLIFEGFCGCWFAVASLLYWESLLPRMWPNGLWLHRTNYDVQCNNCVLLAWLAKSSLLD